jgi:formate-dependent nitrite reductase membrane component NrfD
MIGGIGFSLYWLLFGVTCVTLGYSSIQIGVLARVMHGLRPKSLEGLRRSLSYNRGMVLSAGSVLVGLVLLGVLVYHYLKSDFKLFEISHPAIFGLLLIIVGFQTFCFTLLLEMAQRVAPENKP